LIVWGKNREHALARAKRALEEFIIEGISTTIPFHLKVLEDERFLTGNFDTSFLEHFKF
jgi:acetyl-CoA carboxylase biotin carboxylase subunit